MHPLPDNTVLGRLRLLEVYDYYDGPRLFAAHNETGSLFLGYWADETETGEVWYYVAVSRKRLKFIRSGGIALRDAFLNAEDGVVTVVTFSKDSAATHALLSTAIPEELLPPKDDRLKMATQTLPTARPKPVEIARKAQREVMAVALKPAGYTRNEASIGLVAGTFNALQGTVQEIGLSLEERKANARLPFGRRSEIERDTSLVAMGAFGGSFGVLVGAAVGADLFGESLIGDSIEQFSRLLNVRADEAWLRQLLQPRVAARYRELFGRLAAGDSGLDFAWGSAKRGRGYEAAFNYWEVKRLAAVLSKTEITRTKEFSIRAKLVGANLRTKRYELLALEVYQKYSGKVEDTAVASLHQAILDATYNATIREIEETYVLTGEPSIKYSLIALAPG
jgi:hypothetical protein